jgi:hypothetical protein
MAERLRSPCDLGLGGETGRPAIEQKQCVDAAAAPRTAALARTFLATVIAPPQIAGILLAKSP